MMRTSSSLGILLVALLVLGGALGYLLLGEGRREHGGLGDLEPAPAIAAALTEGESELIPPPKIHRLDDAELAATTVLWPLRVELDLIQPEYLPTEAGMSPIGSGATAKLSGHVLGPGRRGDVEGIGARATIRFVAGPNEGRVLHTDATGKFGASDLYPGLSIIEVSGTGLVGARREIRLRQGKETIERFPFGSPGSMQGRVVDEQGTGIEGARVTVDGSTVVSAVEGTFYVGGVAPGNVLVEVEHHEHAAYQELVWVTQGRVGATRDQTFTLKPAAQLTIAVQGDVGGPGPVYIVLLPAQGARRMSSESVYRNVRFPYHRLGTIEVWPGLPKTVGGLPEEVVQVHAFRAGAQATMKNANLRRDRPYELKIQLQAAPMITGQVLKDGVPVPRADVVLEAPNRVRAVLTYLRQGAAFLETGVMPSLPPGRQETVTDKSGRFVLSAWEDVSATRYLEARGPDGRSWAGRLVRRGETVCDLELREPDLADSSLGLDLPGRYQGLPVELFIDGTPQDPWILPPDQDLEVSSLLAGTWSVRLSWRSEPVFEEVLDVTGTTQRTVPLPLASIEGQDEEAWSRAGREYPRSP